MAYCLASQAPSLYFATYNAVPVERPMKAVKISSEKLMVCRVAADGSTVELEFLDHAGTQVALELSLDQAEAVVMTLPHLLANATKLRTGSDDARYVFGLSDWCIEGANRSCLIATLKTTDGFEVSFGIPLEVCRSFGWNLQHKADQAHDAGGERAVVASRVKLN
jgi:hypothetical protein